jgi:hypothetical protein
MVELSGNLIDFHVHVHENVGSLAAYGEVIQNSDLLTSLFESYEAVEYEKFQQYISHKWKKIPPTSGETTKEVDKKVWNWCKNHKAWGQYTYESCRSVAIKKYCNTHTNTVNNTTTQPTLPSPTPEVEVNNKLSSIVESGGFRLH